MKTSTKGMTTNSTVAAVMQSIVDRTLLSFKTRDQSRMLAKALSVNPKVSVKRDIKDANGLWSVELVHNDGKGIMSISRKPVKA